MTKTFKEFLAKQRLKLAVECCGYESCCGEILNEAHGYDIDELLQEYKKEEDDG